MTRLIEEEETFKVLSAYYKHSTPVQDSALHDALSRVPSADLVNEWCTDCKEYDQSQHCCHRFTKVIRQAQEELKQNAVTVIRCAECYFWNKEPSQTAMPEVHTCRYWRIGTTCVDYCARASRDGWLKAMSKETEK